MYYNTMPVEGERFFWAPFLLGGLGGAAIVSATRPRPVYITSPAYPQQSYPQQSYQQGQPGYGYNYYGGYNYNPYFYR
ncbi:MAG: hypothetical protein PHG03_01560 [Bacilli bacterium]|nr:hypothetical protein [Bacilli bacterium]